MDKQFSVITSKNRGLNTQIASDIARRILSGSLKEGDTLPNEMDLCEQFGVSRTALREALKLLASKGLLESRPKIGTKIKQRSNWNLFDVQLLEWMGHMEGSKEMHLQFLELRRAIEPHASFLAATNATKEQRIELSKIFDSLCEVADDFDPKVWVDIDTKFHCTIFLSTGNSFYIAFGNVLTTIFKWFIGYSSKEGGVCLEDHQAIYKAIMLGDSQEAYNASFSLMTESKHRLMSD